MGACGSKDEDIPHVPPIAARNSSSMLEPSVSWMPAFVKKISITRVTSLRGGKMKQVVELETSRFQKHPRSTTLTDIEATDARIHALSAATTQGGQAGSTMLNIQQKFASEWLDALRAAGSDSAEVGSCIDMLMVGDFGKDLDDEKALAMAVALRRTGLVGKLSVMTNFGDSLQRARLAKGTAIALGAHDVRVAKGSDAGKTDAPAHNIEDVSYLAPDSELENISGHELAFSAMRESRETGHKLTIVCCSAMTDLAELIQDERWEELAPGTVSHIVHMGGVSEDREGQVHMDPDANNNSVDPDSAKFVYNTLRDDLRFWFIVVTRHAAAECQLSRSAFDGSSHPVALRMTAAHQPALQKLWVRVHQTEVERLLAGDTMPMTRNAEWFRSNFLEPSTPRTLGKGDDIWPYVRGFNEYDGLTTVVAATITHPELFTMFFTPYKCPGSHTLVVGRSAREHGVTYGRKVSEMLHYLMATSMGPGSGEWFGRLCDHQRPGQNHEAAGLDMLLVGDFGKDQDDEKALVMAVAMRRTGLIGNLTILSNLGDSKMRGRLAKGTLNALGAHDVRVASGTDGGRAGEEIHDYEFDACSYLAPDSELDPRGGCDVAFEAISGSRAAGHKVTIVCCSSMTDMANLIQDERWEQLAPGTVSHVAVMGGVKKDLSDGQLRMDPESANNAFDLASAEVVYSRLQADDRFDLIVVTRFAATACQLPKKAFDGSPHPIAQRLTAVARPSLQMLWARTHRTKEERQKMRDGLPMSRDPVWFWKTFLLPTSPTDLGPKDDIWPYVRGFNEYDGLTTVVAATYSYPELFKQFFQPFQCTRNGTLVIGNSETELGIVNQSKASELLHDLLVTAFDSGPRFRKGFKIEVRSSPFTDEWQVAMLQEPARGMGSDSWMALLTEGADKCHGSTCTIPVYLERSTEGVLWRLAHRLGDTEPMLPDLVRTCACTCTCNMHMHMQYALHMHVRTHIHRLLDLAGEPRHPSAFRPAYTPLAIHHPPFPSAPTHARHTIIPSSTLPSQRLGIRYRKVRGVRATPEYVTQGCWNYLRQGLSVREGDVWVSGYPSSGASLVQVMVRTLLHGGDTDAAVSGKYASGITSPLEMDVALSKIDLQYLDALPPASRVFSSHHTPINLPCKGVPTDGGLLPPGIKVVHIVRDPRDCCVSMFHLSHLKCDWNIWVDAFIEGVRVPWAGWLQQNAAWWEAYQRQPEQVLWLSFEECKVEPEKAIERVASFLGLVATDEVVAKTAKALEFKEMKRWLQRHPKLRKGQSCQLSSFTPDQLEMFETVLIQPAREVGIEFQTALPERATESGVSPEPSAAQAPAATTPGPSKPLST